MPTWMEGFVGGVKEHVTVLLSPVEYIWSFLSVINFNPSVRRGKIVVSINLTDSLLHIRSATINSK